MLLDLLANQPQTDIWYDPVFLTIVGSIATIFAGVSKEKERSSDAPLLMGTRTRND